MSLVERMTALQAKLGQLPERLGLPQAQLVELLSPGGTWQPMQPRPLCMRLEDLGSRSAGRRQVGEWLSPAVQVDGDELLLQDVPRPHYGQGYTEQGLYESAYRVSGRTYYAVAVNTGLPTTWQVILKPRSLK